MSRRPSVLSIVGPGLLVAATGVGAGDLATAAFTGGKLGVAVLWAVIVGAFLKFVINEGLTRFQLATGSTLLEGCVAQFGRPFNLLFLVYLLAWSFLVGLALMSACGATMHAILPWQGPTEDKIVYGVAHSLLALVLVRIGGFKLFEKVMTACIGVMFVVVVATAIALRPSPVEILQGLFVPTIPNWRDEGLSWTVALLGGVGGTLTVLCYGYWIREEQRSGPEHLRTCRIDLATGYIMTALFGMAMLVIGGRVGSLDERGARLLVVLSDELRMAFEHGNEHSGWGAVARWSFLVGAWGAVFSSLLGVWQSIPYLFADFWALTRSSADGDVERSAVDTGSRAYQGYLFGLALVPSVGLWLIPFQQAQKIYAIVGALIIPLLSAVLLVLNNSRSRLEADMRNGVLCNVVLLLALAFFLVPLWWTLVS